MIDWAARQRSLPGLNYLSRMLSQADPARTILLATLAAVAGLGTLAVALSDVLTALHRHHLDGVDPELRAALDAARQAAVGGAP
jgi:hypothetical protein